MTTLLVLLLLPSVKPAFATDPVGSDADDPAVWVNPADPSKSRIIGTDKVAAPKGGLYVFDLSGHVVQHIEGLDRPNNVDVLGDLAVVTERNRRRLRIFRIAATGDLKDVTGQTAVFEGEKGEDAAPMGIGLYRREKDGVIFAIVTPKAGPKEKHVAEYRLVTNSEGKVDAYPVRRFGTFSGVKETESVAVDAPNGVVYYSDERVGTRAYKVDPDAPDANKDLAFFNNSGTEGDHEGIAIWPRLNAVVCTDQIPGNSVYRLFSRSPGHTFLGAFTGGADETDGIEICDRPLGPRFPQGIFIAMNSGGRNFLVYDLRDVAKALKNAH